MGMMLPPARLSSWLTPISALGGTNPKGIASVRAGLGEVSPVNSF